MGRLNLLGGQINLLRGQMPTQLIGYLPPCVEAKWFLDPDPQTIGLGSKVPCGELIVKHEDIELYWGVTRDRRSGFNAYADTA